jgi:hypothetical protein
MFCMVDRNDIRRDQATQDEYLDSTRIHPDDYDLAKKIARDAIDVDREGDDSTNYVKLLMENPKKLEDIGNLIILFSSSSSFFNLVFFDL